MPQSLGLQRVGHDLATEHFRVFYIRDHAVYGKKKSNFIFIFPIWICPGQYSPDCFLTMVKGSGQVSLAPLVLQPVSNSVCLLPDA